MVEEIFYQSSLPRSGSTMLQNIMGQNRDIHVTPTDGLLELIYAARENYTNSPEFKAQDADLMEKAFLNFCYRGMMGYCNIISEAPYVLLKGRGWGIHYEFLKKIFPSSMPPKIICMVRDLRDIFASMEKNFRANPAKSNPMLNWSEMRGTTTPKRIDIWAQSQPVGLAVERLSEMIREGIDKNILFVRYEDLCLHPDNEMFRIYDYLGLQPFPHDFDNIEQITAEDDEVYGFAGLHTIRKKLSMKPSDAKAVLGRDVTNWIYETYKWFFEKFRYSK